MDTLWKDTSMVPGAGNMVENRNRPNPCPCGSEAEVGKTETQETDPAGNFHQGRDVIGFCSGVEGVLLFDLGIRWPAEP